MKLLINNQIIEFENKESSVDLIFKNIDEVSSKDNKALSHLVVDGVEIYNDYEDYISEHMASIEVIEAVIKPVNELVMDLFLSAEDYLKRALPELKILIGEFYQGPSNTTWKKFNDLLSGIDWIHNLIAIVDGGSYKPLNWDKYLIIITTVQEELKKMEDAICNSDNILLADILRYEIFPQLEELKQVIGTTIDQGGKRVHVN
jgi:hypothetical protein